MTAAPAGAPRIAYFITSYQSPEQLSRLLRTLRAAQPTAELVVHHDVFAGPIDPGTVAEVGGHLHTSPHPIVWGDMSLDRSRWRVMRWALENLEFDWLVLLSEQDYPIARLDRFAERLRRSGVDAVLDAVPITELPDAEARLDCHRRYDYQYVPLPAWHLTRAWPPRLRGAVRRARDLLYGAIARSQGLVHVFKLPDALGLPNRVGLRAGSRSPFTAAFPCWWSSAWYALSRRGVARLLELVEADPGLMAYYERTIIPLESVVATLLCNAPDVPVERASLHAIRWSAVETGRPDLLADGDAAQLLGSGLFFARKFDPRATALLDELDRHVLRDADGPALSPAEPAGG
ncbi:beta-1,6-N-acetylglucosaminyltransferase [Blastococcus tunisiensis]|uniref:Core-2/I-Branching enzyme n=1 Tax=Blastococcus tunisiensis TaxID=1798228 RepID=A0A1I2JBJ9_9ACTN|nr:beta-1,6-N-acetylglucosaminyltransferase [Blastococcus sp. DSM 46838]SFF51203.1 hypothetical protein SAMN05216574_115106 [Blastococcus sp. DSM 46838]